MKAYRILKNRFDEKFKYLFESDDLVEISHTKKLSDAEPFFGSWTNYSWEFDKDNDIQILVENH